MNKISKLLLVILFLTMPGTGFCQPDDIACGHRSRSVMTSRQYRQGEVLIKFRTESNVVVKKKANGRFSSASASAVDKTFRKIGVRELETLMPLTGHVVSKKKMTAYNGKLINDRDLSQLYLLKFDSKKTVSVDEVVKKLSELSEVEYAEPNYFVYTMDASQYTTEPLYSQQGYLPAVRMPELWAVPATNVLGHRPVIAIIDTGVDTEHPDLANNIWTNESENNGEEAVDDDSNGFKDDIHGWDFVNQTGKIRDNNGHGTHCAGIAAAVGDNGIGIAGTNPDALIMPVTVMQSDGTGDVATIIKGIDYASANNADIISMSIGGYTHSIAEEQALAKAYSKCILVAAAGNDCFPISSIKCPYCGEYGSPCFPAAFTFVLGVQAGDAIGMFSNFDDDGPTFSKYNEEQLYNYELKAPGLRLLSTYPGGRYKSLSGTSMACPLVAGIVSRLIQNKVYLSKEILFGDLIHSSQSYVDAIAAYNITDADRQPSLSMLTYRLDDSKSDNDGRPDAGDTLLIYPTLRNDWGQADNIHISIEIAENEDPSLVEFLIPDVDFGNSLSSYAKAETRNPLMIRLSDDIVDGRHLRLLIKATYDNISEEMQQEIVLNVENGVELGGTQCENITLYPNVHYIVTRNWGIPRDVIVTVKPGTTLKIKDGVGISNYGYMIFEGTPDSMIVVTKGDNDLGQIGGFLNDNANYIDFNNVIFDNLHGITFDGHTYEHCVIRNCEINTSYYFSSGGTFRDCDIYNNTLSYNSCWFSDNATFIECNIHNNEIIPAFYIGGFGSAKRFYHSNYIGNTNYAEPKSYKEIYTPGVDQLDESNCYGNYYDQFGGYYSIYYNTTEPEIAYLSECYLGTSSEDVAYESILDEVDNVGWGHVDIWKMAKSAFINAPGCVDYIEVDGYDPQDQADEIPPIGVGKHEVAVGFNRAMDQSVAPTITFGVRPPYTQKTVAEDGYWYDPYTYIAYFTIDGKSATDGMNRIRVSDYRQKNSDFEMPMEAYRYNINIQAAGSMSTGMIAMAGLGKVTLNWETDDEDFDDLLGYNVYRFTDSSSDTVKINTEIIESGEESFVDYDVVPGTTYYYFLREIGTDLSQNDVSNTVAATPLTAQMGDANGSMAVDVADVMTEIAYLANENPQPFIFEAADVNSDLKINILDVVGTLQIITNPVSQTMAIDDEATAKCWIEDGKLFVETPVAIGGVQIQMNADAEVKASAELGSMEQLNAQISAESRIFLAYSMSGATLVPGVHELILADEGLDISDIVLSTPRGANIKVVFDDPTGITSVRSEELGLRSGIYNLQGMHVNENYKGIIIVDDKKVINK